MKEHTLAFARWMVEETFENPGEGYCLIETPGTIESFSLSELYDYWFDNILDK